MAAEREVLVKAKLAASREEMLALASSLDESDWNRLSYAEGSEWRLIDILRHVADSERGMTRLIVQIQGGGEGVPPDFDLHRWNQRAVSKLEDKTVADLLAGMDASRAELLAVIDSLDDGDWDKQGRHASLRIMTIEEVCHLIADHEQGHATLMKEALAG
jgi:uncharacterized protein (TIGR03083 family)